MPELAQIDPPVTTTEHPHVVRSPGTCGGRPRIRGTRVSVRTIARLFREGDAAADIAEAYPHLEPAAIYDAISYYLDHRSEIDREIEENRLENVLAKQGAKLDDNGVIRFSST